MQKDNLLGDTIRALGFLSRLPLPQAWFSDQPESLTHTARAFPLAGLALGLLAGIPIYLGFQLGLPALACGLIAVASLAAMTGALHEDGLGDTADGFFGGNTIERRLDIMKDSTIGTFAAITLITAIGLKAVLLAAIIERSGAGTAILALIGAESASRALMVSLWFRLPVARPGGLSDRAGKPNAQTEKTAFMLGAAVLAITGYCTGGIAAVLLASALTVAALLGFARLCLAKIGGETGDTLGAGQQIAALCVIASLVITI